MVDNSISPIEEIAKIAKHIPLTQLQDINQRVMDWLAGGGEVDDPYIHQQLRYAKRFIPKISEV